jgi:hypothetical protein
MPNKKRSRNNDISKARKTSGYVDLLKTVSGYLAEARKSSVRAVNSLMTATYWFIGRRIVEFEQGGKDRAEYGAALLARLADDLTAKFGRGFSKRNLAQMRLFYLGWEICRTPSDILELHAKCSIVLSKSNRHTHDGVPPIAQTVSAQSKCETVSSKSSSENSEAPSQNSYPLKRATVSLKSTLPADGASHPILQTLSAKSPGLSDIANCFLLPWSHYVRLLSVENWTSYRAKYKSDKNCFALKGARWRSA